MTGIRWPQVPLGQVVDLVAGVTPKGVAQHLDDSMVDRSDAIPFYKVGDMNLDPARLMSARAFVRSDVAIRLGMRIAPVGAVVFPKAGGAIATNKKRVVARAGAIDLNCMAAVPGPSVESGYLRLWFESLDLSKLSDGSVLPQLSKKTMSKLLLPLPPRTEQRRIVEVLEDHLSRLDTAESLLAQAVRRLAAYDQGCIDEVMLVRAERESWPVMTLEECAAPERGSICDGPFGSHLTSAHYTSGGAHVIRLQNIGDGVFRRADAFIPMAHYETLTKHAAVPGDVVVASLGDELPRAAVVPDLGGPAIVKADCIRVRPSRGVDARWLVVACRSRRARRWASERLHGVGRQRLGLAGIRAIPVPLPDLATQEQALDDMETRLAASKLMYAALVDNRTRLMALRTSLLTSAFRGEL